MNSTINNPVVINQIIDSLNIRLDEIVNSSSNKERPHIRSEPKKIIYLKNEILIFSELTLAEVIERLNNIGVNLTKVEIKTEGGPLFFVSNPREDYNYEKSKFLQHEDLPYGFAEPDGSFQFGDPNISLLRKPETPISIFNTYLYLGRLRVTYSEVSNPANERRMRFLMNGIAMCIYNNKQTILSQLDNQFENMVANIKFQRDNGSTYYAEFATRNGFRDALYRQPDRMAGYIFESGLRTNVYNPAEYVGWTFESNSSPYAAYDRSIFKMPENQLKSFEVNPANQQPYYGAEGVYPVITVEFKEDHEIGV